MYGSVRKKPMRLLYIGKILLKFENSNENKKKLKFAKIQDATRFLKVFKPLKHKIFLFVT